MKPYQSLAIVECGEPLLPIPDTLVALVSPHPYENVGAPYGNKSPFYLREGVLNGLIAAQERLQAQHPDWRIQVFDAYRPIAVQQYMVDYTFRDVARSKGLPLDHLTESQREAILELVYEFWAVPSLDPATPPPHSTGGAIDVTLVDESGVPFSANVLAVCTGGSRSLRCFARKLVSSTTNLPLSSVSSRWL